MKGSIFRCGWCGLPTKVPLKVDATEYLEENEDSAVERVHGYCCLHEKGRQMFRVTREMAIDAEMSELEGKRVEW